MDNHRVIEEVQLLIIHYLIPVVPIKTKEVQQYSLYFLNKVIELLMITGLMENEEHKKKAQEENDQSGTSNVEYEIFC